MKKSVMQQFGRNSIFIRLLVLIFVGFFLMIAMLSTVVYQYSASTWEKNVVQIHEQAAQRGRDMGDNIFFGMIRLATQISLDSNTMKYVLFETAPTDEATLTTDMMTNLNINSIVYDYIDGIHIYSKVRNELVNNRAVIDMSEENAYDWEEALESQGVTTAGGLSILARTGRVPGENYPYFISIVKPISLDEVVLGYVVIDLNVSKLNDIFNDKEADIGSQFYITTDAQEIFLQRTMQKDIVCLADVVDWADVLSGSQDETLLYQEEYMLSTMASDNTPLWYVTCTPVAQYAADMQSVAVFVLWLVGASVIFALIVAMYLTRRIYEPIEGLVNFVGKQETEIVANKQERSELEYIIRSFEKASDVNARMKEALQHNRQRLDQAQTVALQAQITPHFLHNTLETIRFKTMQIAGGENEAGQMIQSLSSIFQVNMESDGYFTTVEKEIAYCKEYLSIMQIRYADKFQVVWDVPSELLPYYMIKLSLQPLIENAIYHGVKPMRGSGVITIRMQEIGDLICVCVRDNGVGISLEHCKELNDKLRSDIILQGKHIGLANVSARIALIFGEGYGLEVRREPVGAAIEMYFPKVNQIPPL